MLDTQPPKASLEAGRAPLPFFLRTAPPMLRAHRLQTLGRLITSMVHDVRDPVSSIQQTAEYLAHHLGDVPAPLAREQLDEIVASCRSLSSMIGRVLAFSHGDYPKWQEVALCEQVADTSALLGHLLRAGAHELHCTFAPDADRVLGDPSLVQQILVNLVTNAAHAAPTGAAIHVDSRRLRAGETSEPRSRGSMSDWVRVRVTDDGPGVPVELTERIFDPFFTTRPNGVGIGLTTARDAAIALGGTLEHEPSQRGACFAITLRAAPADASSR